MGKRKPRLKLEDTPRWEFLVKALKRAWKDAKRGRYNIRDLALVAILTFTGCRLGEALRMRADDLDPKARTVKIHQEKKRREFVRIVPVPNDFFWKIIEKYLKNIPFSDAKLFNVSDRQARNIVYKFSEKYLGRRIRPHAIRHSYATMIIRKTHDLEIARRLLGHAGYRVLKDYLNYTQEDLEKILARILRSE